MVFITFLLCNNVMAQKSQTDSIKPAPKKNWYESFSIRGYMQVRYNRLLETNENLKCEQCDRSWGAGGGFGIRRGRIIISGNLSKNVYFYIQPDFGSAIGTTQNIFQLRDAYVDVGFDRKNEFRIRIGQSKVPFGFENMQSSQNRLPLDRNDALNSALSNERDLGAFLYWAPENIRIKYPEFINDNRKGSGDYGVIAFGVYNGQTANRPEQNKKVHIVSRISYPIKIKNQVLEPGVQAYTGEYVLPAELRSAGVKAANGFAFKDERAAVTLNLYPNPIGLLTEYNWGRGPQYNPLKDSIEVRNLKGGYATLYGRIKSKKHKDMFFFPYTRVQQYNGGKKHELDARAYNVKEVEMGMEWQVNKYFELTTAYTISERRFEDSKLRQNFQKGNLLRIQAQLNF